MVTCEKYEARKKEREFDVSSTSHNTPFHIWNDEFSGSTI